MARARKKQNTTERAELNRIIEAMREEVAREFGLTDTESAHFADLSSRVCGKFGYTLLQRAKAISGEQQEQQEHGEGERTRR